MFYINDFLSDLAERRLRHSTIKAYQRLLERFKEHCRKRGISEIVQVGMKEALSFIDSFILGLRMTRAIRIKVCRLQAYFRFLEEKGVVFLSPLKDYRPPDVPRAHYPVLSEVEMKAILQSVSTSGNLMAKGKALLELAYSSALRPRELYNLKISDIDFQRCTLFIRQSKNRKDRLVPVGRRALYWVNRYIRKVRPRYLKDKSRDYVFVSHKTGEPSTVYGVRWAIQETLRRSGIKPIKPYSLRGSAATHLLLGGMSVLHIRKLLGHENVSTTQYYLDLKLKELKKKLSEKHPRRRIEKILEKKGG